MKILVSPGWGAGWTTWIDDEPAKTASLTDSGLIEAIENHGRDSVEFATALAAFVGAYPDTYTGGAHQLTVEEVPTGAIFRIHEYDGSETVDIFEGPGSGGWRVAT